MGAFGLRDRSEPGRRVRYSFCLTRFAVCGVERETSGRWRGRVTGRRLLVPGPLGTVALPLVFEILRVFFGARRHAHQDAAFLDAGLVVLHAFLRDAPADHRADEAAGPSATPGSLGTYARSRHPSVRQTKIGASRPSAIDKLAVQFNLFDKHVVDSP